MNRKLSNPELFILRALIGNTVKLWDLLDAMRGRNFIRKGSGGELVFRRMIARLEGAELICISNLDQNPHAFLGGMAWTTQTGMEKIAAQGK